jgi:S-phase kinase-associated protein 1
MAEFTSSTDRGVILVSGDNEEFQVSFKAASLSVMVHNIIGEDEQDVERRIPLPNVRKEILSKVLEFCNHYTEEKMTEFVKVRLTFLLIVFSLTFPLTLPLPSL